MNTYLGIDGGGSGSRALAVDENGSVLWRKQGPSANCRELNRADFWAGLDFFWQEIQNAGYTPMGVGMGLAGVVSPGMANILIRDGSTRWSLPRECLTVESDLRAAHRGGFQNGPGIVLVSGTGSSCLGRGITGAWHQCGGWGSLLDDAGSGYYMGLEGLRLALQMIDGRQEVTGLKVRLFNRLNLETPQDLVQWIHGEKSRKTDIAQLFQELLALDAEGDPVASSILSRGRQALVNLVVTTVSKVKLKTPRLLLVGGVAGERGTFGRHLKAALHQALPDVSLIEAELPPEGGALLGLLESRGIPLRTRFLENLKDSLRQNPLVE